MQGLVWWAKQSLFRVNLYCENGFVWNDYDHLKSFHGLAPRA